jgi:hypothetical protein
VVIASGGSPTTSQERRPSFQLGRLVPENLHRLIELLDLQNRDLTDLKNPIEDLALPAWNSTRIDSTSTWTGCWWAGESSIRLSSKFVSEILLCLSEIELVDHVKLAPSALFEFADQNWV